MKIVRLFFQNPPKKEQKTLNQFVASVTVITIILFLILATEAKSQNIGINATGATPNASAALDVDMTNKGLLIPRVALTSTTDVVTVPTPATSLLVYNNNAAMTGGAIGFYYWNGANWVSLTPPATASDWTLLGNAGTNAATNFLGTTDNVALNFRVNNQKAGTITTTGPTFFGYQAGNANAGTLNTAFGYQALMSNASSQWNVAVGYQALMNLTCCNWASTAVGYRSLANWPGGGIGPNTALGYRTLEVTTGGWNIAMGNFALGTNTSGNTNTAIGAGALNQNTTSNDNTGVGANVLNNISLGNNNTALGSNANITVANLTNTLILGGGAAVAVSNKTRLGNVSQTVIEGQVAYSFPSDGRFKNNVTEEVRGIEFIKKLRPVVYNFDTKKFNAFLLKNLSDSARAYGMSLQDYEASTAIRQSGFVAQEVEQAAKETGYDFNGVHHPENENDNYSVAYSLFVVPLVKAVQELNNRTEEQQKIIEEMKKEIHELKKQINK